uniref:alpha/beta fold hydrolase n=1 Tax=Gemmiger formicilis TaxID=745368 RepID=UPI003FF14542
MIVTEFGIKNEEVIILLHGGGLSWWNYTDEIELLKNQFHIILPALDGHSGSDADHTSIEDNAARIIKYIDEKFDGQVLMICGLSLGGQILLEILSQRKDICKFAIIESALALPMPVTHSLIELSIKLSYGLIQQKWFSKLQMRSLKIRSDLFDDYYRDTRAISSENYIRFMESNSAYRVKPSLSLCRTKSVIVVGSKERPIMKKSAKMIQNLIPNSELIIVKDYHHGDLSMNHADEYVKYMTTLMK